MESRLESASGPAVSETTQYNSQFTHSSLTPVNDFHCFQTACKTTGDKGESHTPKTQQEDMKTHGSEVCYE